MRALLPVLAALAAAALAATPPADSIVIGTSTGRLYQATSPTAWTQLASCDSAVTDVVADSCGGLYYSTSSNIYALDFRGVSGCGTALLTTDTTRTITSLTVDGARGNVYFADGDNVYSVPVGGLAPVDPTLVIGDDGVSGAIIGVDVDVSRSTFYWSVNGQNATGYPVRGIYKSDLTGGNMAPLFTYAANQNWFPLNLEIDEVDGYLLWLEKRVLDNGVEGGALQRMILPYNGISAVMTGLQIQNGLSAAYDTQREVFIVADATERVINFRLFSSTQTSFNVPQSVNGNPVGAVFVSGSDPASAARFPYPDLVQASASPSPSTGAAAPSPCASPSGSPTPSVTPSTGSSPTNPDGPDAATSATVSVAAVLVAALAALRAL